ncbi:MAG: hypothetical protein ACXVNF_01195 [Neobacillus sp.]
MRKILIFSFFVLVGSFAMMISSFEHSTTKEVEQIPIGPFAATNNMV